MHPRWTPGIAAALGLLVACGAPPGLPEGPCGVDDDCGDGLVCEQGVCRAPGHPGPVGGGGVLQRADGGLDGGADGGLDGGADGGALQDGGRTDLGGGVDAGIPDLGPTEDAGSGTDGGVDAGGLADAGVPGVVPPGVYAFRRLTPSGLPNGQGLWRVAVSPDDDVVVAGSWDGRLYIVDRASESLLRQLSLPKTASSIRLGDLAFAPSSGVLLAAATAIESGTPTGQLFELDPQGGKVSLLGTSRGMSFERIVFWPSGDADIVGYDRRSGGRYLLGLHQWSAQTRRLSLTKVESVNAGCEGLALADDGLGGTARVYTCGIAGGDIGHFDPTLTRYRGPGAGNVSHVDAHPSGAYAIAVAWGGARLLRFSAGTWVTGGSAPDLVTPQLQKPEFSGDGDRAIIVGAYDRLGRVAELREYRHGAYSTRGIADVSIRGFDQAPYFGVNGAGIFDAAWRPGCDEGYLVGGCGGVECSRGWLIHFEVTNGVACRAHP